jgi:asparagine synthase (glutamine-hydrolysing)
MPGIVGIISRQKPSAECSRLVTAMLACMKHERFYETGTCFVPEMGVYGGWIAHKGSYAASQSTSSRDESVSVLFSGECFDPGVDSGDDLREVYRRSGDRFVAELNGLFSGVVIDRLQRRALLFNDRYGVERLYFYEAGDAVYFASEAKALLYVLPELRAFDDEAVAEFLSFGCTLGGKSLFRHVRFLEGGSLWSFENGSCRKKRYFDRQTWERQTPLSAEAFESEFAETFSSKVLPRYVGPGLPIGISLTGGLDTRMIMACLPPSEHKPVCYTFSGFNGDTGDDRVAASVAATCGLNHHILRLESDFITQFGDYADRTAYVTDGCSGPTGAHEIYLNARARQLAPVRLTGNFGSEILRGVSGLRPRSLSGELFNDEFKPVVDAVTSLSLRHDEHSVGFAAFEEIPWRLFGTMAAAKSQILFRTPYLDTDLVALAYRAPLISRQSSAPALNLVEKCNPALGRIQTDRGLLRGRRGAVHGMARLFSEVTFKLDYFYTEGLPARLSPFDSMSPYLFKAKLLGRHKYLPFRRWFRKELAPYVTEVLADRQTSRLPYWNRKTLASMASDHISGRKNYVREIDAVLTLEAADRLIIHNSPREVPVTIHA